EDTAVLVELIIRGHPQAKSKLAAGVRAIVVDIHREAWGKKGEKVIAFHIETTDGNRTPISIRNVMLKACGSSAEQRRLMEEMQLSGMMPNVVSFTTLIGTLIAEGKDSEAREAGTANVYHVNVMLKACDSSAERRRLMEEMQLSGVMPDVVSFNTMIGRMIAEGKDSEAREAGTVDVYHVSVMLKACDGSAEQRRLMEEMQLSGMMPDVVSFTTLIGTLIAEGKDSEARESRGG
ncbi:hypothetical protein CYMTET_13741, partial [Cymbomonas tetramitiformis]